MVELVYCVFVWLACSVAFSLVLPSDIAVAGVTVSMALYAAVRLSFRWWWIQDNRPTHRTLERTQRRESPAVRQAGSTLTEADWRWLGMEPPAQIPPPAKRLEGPR